MGVWQNSWLHDWEFHHPIRSNQERVLDSHTRLFFDYSTIQSAKTL